LNEIPGALLDALIDTAKLLPILFLTYLAMEAIEHYAGERTYAWIKKARGAGPLFGGLMGIIPQCGFAGGAASLYAAGAVTAGTLAAVFVATSDEMLPILISEGSGAVIWKIMLFKFIAAVISGFAVDICLRAVRRKSGSVGAEEDVNISAVCERDGCACEEDEHGGIFLPALHHTLKIGLLILVASALLGVVFCFVGEDELSRLPINVPVLGEAMAALLGLIGALHKAVCRRRDGYRADARGALRQRRRGASRAFPHERERKKKHCLYRAHVGARHSVGRCGALYFPAYFVNE